MPQVEIPRRPRRPGRSVTVTGPTPELTAEVVELIIASNYPDTACRRAGITPATLADWQKRAGKGEKVYLEFFEALAHAGAVNETKLVSSVDKEGGVNWRASWALLSRRYRENWGETPPQSPFIGAVENLNLLLPRIHTEWPPPPDAPGSAIPKPASYEQFAAVTDVEFETVAPQAEPTAAELLAAGARSDSPEVQAAHVREAQQRAEERQRADAQRLEIDRARALKRLALKPKPPIADMD